MHTIRFLLEYWCTMTSSPFSIRVLISEPQLFLKLPEFRWMVIAEDLWIFMAFVVVTILLMKFKHTLFTLLQFFSLFKSLIWQPWRLLFNFKYPKVTRLYRRALFHDSLVEGFRVKYFEPMFNELFFISLPVSIHHLLGFFNVKFTIFFFIMCWFY